MLPRKTLRLVLLVSLAHSLVHVFEFALPSVELMIGQEFGVGRDQTGLLGTVWRLPFGLGAMLAGWLADRYGTRQMLVVYLAGCGISAVLAFWAPSLPILFGVMFLMGTFASIYHPSGLALISMETTAATRPAALGLHGVFGSLGIAAAPFLAALVFQFGSVTWRQYFLVLTVPAAMLIVFLLMSIRRTQRHEAAGKPPDGTIEPSDDESWARFYTVVGIGVCIGFIYAAFVHFLPRYLDAAQIHPAGMSPESVRNYMAAFVLVFAALGQGVCGKIARPRILELQFSLILLSSVPALIWMAFAEGPMRLWAACLVAFIHFMNQPVYNSLIAKYVPHHRRSLAYGFSYTLGFSLGGLGPACAGLIGTDQAAYGLLAAVAIIGAAIAFALARHRGQSHGLQAIE